MSLCEGFVKADAFRLWSAHAVDNNGASPFLCQPPKTVVGK